MLDEGEALELVLAVLRIGTTSRRPLTGGEQSKSRVKPNSVLGGARFVGEITDQQPPRMDVLTMDHTPQINFVSCYSVQPQWIQKCEEKK